MRDVPCQRQALKPRPQAQAAAAEPCKPGEAQSAEQSSSARAVAAAQQQADPEVLEPKPVDVARPQPELVQRAQAERQQRAGELPAAAAHSRVSRAAVPEQQVSQQQELRPQGAGEQQAQPGRQERAAEPWVLEQEVPQPALQQRAELQDGAEERLQILSAA